MIANSAFLAAMLLVLALFALVGQLEFLAPYKHLLLGPYLAPLVTVLVVLFVNLFAACYWLGRVLFLKDTGRKLAHVEKLLETPDTIVRDLSDRLAQDE